MTVKLDESHAHALAIEGAVPTGYGLGKAGWVTVPLRAPGVSIDVLRDWVEESYRIVAPKKLVAELDSVATRCPRQAASARRSSTVDPRSVSWRSKRPAHSDERSGAASRLAAVVSPSRARTSTASSR